MIDGTCQSQLFLIPLHSETSGKVIDLNIHIEFLLCRNKCVIVPRIGAFMLHSHSAQINMSAREVLPPTNSVTFNAAVCNNDPMLAHSIARREGISFIEAEGLMEEEVDRMIDELETTGSLSINRVGTLTLGKEDNVVFTPYQTPAQDAASIGRLPLQLPYRAVATVADDSIDDREDNSRNKYYYFRIRKSVLKSAAALAAIAICAGSALLGVNTFNNDGHQDYASVVPVKAIQETISQISRPAKLETVRTEMSDSVIKITESDNNVAEESEGGRYQLIVGTFTTESEKERFMALHSDSPYSFKEFKGKKLIRLSVQGSDERSELVSTLRSEKLKKHFPGSWIWERE